MLTMASSVLFQLVYYTTVSFDVLFSYFYFYEINARSAFPGKIIKSKYISDSRRQPNNTRANKCLYEDIQNAELIRIYSIV